MTRPTPPILRLTAALTLALGLAACGDDSPADATPDTGPDTGVVDTGGDDTGVQPGDECVNDDCVAVHQPLWTAGERWLVASIYRLGQAKVPEWLEDLASTDLDGSAEELLPPEGWEPDADQSWGSPIIWEFLVVAADVVPTGDSPLAGYTVAADGSTQSLTVIRVTAPPSINDPEVTEGLDPTFYVILGNSDGHARAVHFDYRVANGRNTVVLELPTGNAGAIAAQHDLFVVPYLMPAFPIAEGDYTAVVGAGTVLDELAVKADGDSALVSFRTQPDGRVVQQEWQDGAVWFDVSATPDRISWMIDPSEIPFGLDDAKSLLPKDDDDLEDAESIEDKFRSAIRLDRAYEIAPGSYESAVQQDFEPWAGFWWPLNSAPTAFGWSRGDRRQHDDMPSVVLRELVTERLSEMDRIGEELRDLDRESDEYDEKRDRYFELRDEVREVVWESTDGLAERFRNGEIDLTNIDDFSPLTKWGIYLMANKLSEHPFEALAWEVIKQYNPVGGSWWGKCNGWAAAAMLTDEPRETLTFDIPAAEVGAEGETVSIPFEAGDVKAMVSGVYYSTMSHFYGARYNDEDDDLSDLHANAFHRLITYYIGEEKFPLVFDVTASEAVWNYPAYAYNMEITDGGVRWEGTSSINAASQSDLGAVDGVSDDAARAIRQHLNRNGRITDMADLADIDGVDQAVVDALSRTFSVHGETRAMNVVTDLVFSTDGVPEDHIDVEGGDPEGFTKHYTYSLFVDPSGNVTGGEWTGASVEEHPDFAWVPYTNNARRASDYDRYSRADVRSSLYDGRYAPSENPFLFTDVMDRMVQVRVNAPVVCNPSPDDCPSGFRCDPVDGSCVEDDSPAPSCAGGPTEDQAVALQVGTLTDLAICENTDAWFAITAEAGDQVAVDITFTHADGDIDAELRDASGNVLSSSTSISDAESVVAAAAAAGTFYLRVYGYNGAANTVSIETTLTATGGGTDGCGDEAAEPNDAQGEATALSADGFSGNICAADDVDWFLLPDDVGDVTVTLEFIHADGDLDLKSFDADGNRLESAAGTSDTEALSASGGEYLQVYGYRGATGLYAIDFE